LKTQKKSKEPSRQGAGKEGVHYYPLQTKELRWGKKGENHGGGFESKIPPKNAGEDRQMGRNYTFTKKGKKQRKKKDEAEEGRSTRPTSLGGRSRQVQRQCCKEEPLYATKGNKKKKHN